MNVQLTTYDGFAHDWNALDSAAQKVIGGILKRLYRNPYEPALLRACELASDERYACPLPAVGYVVYWKILSNSQGTHIRPRADDLVEIKLTAMRPLPKSK